MADETTGKLILGQMRRKKAGTERSRAGPDSFLARMSVKYETSTLSTPSPRLITRTTRSALEALRNDSRKARSSPRKTTAFRARPFVSCTTDLDSSPESPRSQSESMATATRALTGRPLSQLRNTSAGGCAFIGPRCCQKELGLPPCAFEAVRRPPAPQAHQRSSAMRRRLVSAPDETLAA